MMQRSNISKRLLLKTRWTSLENALNAPPMCFIVLYKTCKVTLEISGTAGECQVNSVSVTVDAG